MCQPQYTSVENGTCHVKLRPDAVEPNQSLLGTLLTHKVQRNAFGAIIFLVAVGFLCISLSLTMSILSLLFRVAGAACRSYSRPLLLPPLAFPLSHSSPPTLSGSISTFSLPISTDLSRSISTFSPPITALSVYFPQSYAIPMNLFVSNLDQLGPRISLLS